MNRPLCSTSRCKGRGHVAGCDSDKCRGCLPRPAADGLWLCAQHVAWLGEDSIAAARLHGELAQRLLGGQGIGDKVSGTPGPQYPDQRAVEARTLIRHTLAAWCRLIAEERGVELPADQVVAMGEFVALHASWLAAQSFAREASDELHELAQGKPRSVAYPTGTHVVTVGCCPREVPDEHGEPQCCPGTLMAVMRRADSLLPSEVACDAHPDHRWDSTQWRQLDRLVGGRRAA